MITICVANKKGGIGKTTTATSLAGILSRKYKTLIIDADPQGNTTDTYKAITKDTATLYDVILDYDEETELIEAIQKTDIGDIVASDPLLVEAENRFKIESGEEYFRLKDKLDRLQGHDFVIIDTAPTDNKLLRNCLIASDFVIIPCTADRYGVQGLADLNNVIKTVQKRSNPQLKILGLLLIKYHGTYNLSKEVLEGLEAVSGQLQTSVFDTKIRECESVRKAQAERKLVVNAYKNCNTSIDYYNFTNEILRRLEM